MLLVGIMGIRHYVRPRITFGLPLICAARSLGQFPLVFEKILKKAVAPLPGCSRPCHFDATADGVARNAGLVCARPAKALIFNRCGFGLLPEVTPSSCTVSLAEGMAACNQRDGLFIVHRHATE